MMPEFQIDHELPATVPCIVLDTPSGWVAFVSAAFIYLCATNDKIEEAAAVATAALAAIEQPLRLVVG